MVIDLMPPRVAPATLTGGAPIVVLAPHPDDESLGCGALLAHAFAHRGAHVICMTDGCASHPGSLDWPAARLSAKRRIELDIAVACLGGTTANATWLGHPDGWLGAQDQTVIALRIAAICRVLGARHLFATAEQDHHEDHKSTARIARQVSAILPRVTHFAYPVWSRHDDPDLMARVSCHRPVSIDPYIARTVKRAAISSHATQLGHLVRDDPAGFVLDPAFIDMFVDTPEVYWRVPS